MACHSRALMRVTVKDILEIVGGKLLSGDESTLIEGFANLREAVKGDLSFFHDPRYDTLLAALPLRLPPRQPDRLSSWHLYAVEIDDHRTLSKRTDVFNKLREAGIGVNVHYIPIHTQPFYRSKGFAIGQFPFAEAYYAHAISIPLYPALSSAQQDHVVAELSKALGA